MAERTRLAVTTIQRAERAEGEAAITIAQENEIRRVLTAAGIEFIAENGIAGARLKQSRGEGA